MSFNSVLDFLVVATTATAPVFLPYAGFNSVLDFLVVATAGSRVESAVDGVVSIPSWIFWSSQRETFWIPKKAATGFNSVLDFLVVATRLRVSPVARAIRFNSVLDFLVVATKISKPPRIPEMWFQFRLGFSGRRNPRSVVAFEIAQASFNSVLDFLVVATHRN